jgi:hypothetical protein
MINVHYMDVWKCHNETHYFVQLIYATKNILRSLLNALYILIHLILRMPV